MNIENIVIAWITVFAFAMLVISLRAFRRSKHRKILFVSGAFGIFFIKGIILTLGLFYEDKISSSSLWLLASLFDLGVLILLFVATLKR